jgi:hypothetical protein
MPTGVCNDCFWPRVLWIEGSIARLVMNEAAACQMEISFTATLLEGERVAEAFRPEGRLATSVFSSGKVRHDKLSCFELGCRILQAA